MQIIHQGDQFIDSLTSDTIKLPLMRKNLDNLEKELPIFKTYLSYIVFLFVHKLYYLSIET